MVIRFLTCPSLDGSSLFPRKERERGSLYFSAIYYPKDSFLQLKNGAVQSNSFPRFFSRSDRRTLKESKIMAARGHVFRRRRFQHTKNFWKNLFFIFFLFLSFRALEPPCRFSFGLRAPLFFRDPWRSWIDSSPEASEIWPQRLRPAGEPTILRAICGWPCILCARLERHQFSSRAWTCKTCVYISHFVWRASLQYYWSIVVSTRRPPLLTQTDYFQLCSS